MIIVVFGPSAEQHRFVRMLSNLFDIYFSLEVMPHDLVNQQARFMREAGSGNLCVLGFVDGTKPADVRAELANWSELVQMQATHLHVDEFTV